MPRNTFTDPAGVVPAYTWDIGHNEEQDFGRETPVSDSVNVAGTRVITQQGDPSAIRLSYSGSILTRAQLVQMWKWELLCQTQTIYFTDFAGDEYEVVIDSFKPVRHSGRNRRGGTDAPMWYWTYTIEMTVVRVLTGPLHDAGITA